MTVYLLPNTQKPEAMQMAGKVGNILSQAGIRLVMDKLGSSLAPQGDHVAILPEDQAYRECDIVVTLGGDGTMLHAAHKIMNNQKPLLGINIGRLGFLTCVESNELHLLNRLASGDYHVEHRSVLQASVDNAENAPYLAWNDVVLFKKYPERTITLDIYCDDILVSQFRGDGVIFSTPTGSTAYSMSAGGPIVDARLNGVVVTQICAHIGQTPPLVFASDRTLQVVPHGKLDERVAIICDGTNYHTVGPGEAITIRQSERTVPLVQFSKAKQLESIDRKLKGR
ncbi:MAG: NAD(+)/NADH kinase [Ruminococcaceae bacterium]|nr:NAD(+)/NADH kinase [Oscillospiraceae bacterium]